jgi:hypothetical protein
LAAILPKSLYDKELRHCIFGKEISYISKFWHCARIVQLFFLQGVLCQGFRGPLLSESGQIRKNSSCPSMRHPGFQPMFAKDGSGSASQISPKSYLCTGFQRQKQPQSPVLWL